MGALGRCCVTCCEAMHGAPSRILCIFVLMLQAGILDYYLMTFNTPVAWAWLIADAVNLILVVVSLVISSRLQASWRENRSTGRVISLVWLVWLVSSLTVAGRMLVAFTMLVTDLKEDDFWGENTLKTAIALTACFFVLLLLAHHDSTSGSERRRYIEELTGTVVFDLLDTVDVLEVLVNPADRRSLWPGLEESILAVATLNLVIPTAPLLTLSLTQFGRTKLSRRMVLLHKVLVTLAVNVPNLVLRMLLWHGFSVGISPFILKNVILIGMTLFELFEHQVEVERRHEEKAEEEVAKKEESTNGCTQRRQPEVEQRELHEMKRDQENSDETFPSFAVEERI